jgi:hypothetical protein
MPCEHPYVGNVFTSVVWGYDDGVQQRESGD